jgi:hypothetical protein
MEFVTAQKRGSLMWLMGEQHLSKNPSATSMEHPFFACPNVISIAQTTGHKAGFRRILCTDQNPQDPNRHPPYRESMW